MKYFFSLLILISFKLFSQPTYQDILRHSLKFYQDHSTGTVKAEVMDKNMLKDDTVHSKHILYFSNSITSRTHSGSFYFDDPDRHRIYVNSDMYLINTKDEYYLNSTLSYSNINFSVR